jgi:hypothetical protein
MPIKTPLPAPVPPSRDRGIRLDCHRGTRREAVSEKAPSLLTSQPSHFLGQAFAQGNLGRETQHFSGAVGIHPHVRDVARLRRTVLPADGPPRNLLQYFHILASRRGRLVDEPTTVRIPGSGGRRDRTMRWGDARATQHRRQRLGALSHVRRDAPRSETYFPNSVCFSVTGVDVGFGSEVEDSRFRSPVRLPVATAPVRACARGTRCSIATEFWRD